MSHHEEDVGKEDTLNQSTTKEICRNWDLCKTGSW